MCEIMMDFLLSLRRRSTCKRTQQSCVITDSKHQYVYAIGYGGSAAGQPHDCTGEQGQCGCVHAETNALLKLRTEKADLIAYCTSSPCILCAKAIVNSGQIGKVVYVKQFRQAKGREILKRAGIVLEHAQDYSLTEA